jgi:putative oxidoreductase
MTPIVRKNGLLAITALLTFAFGAAGLSKLAGVEMMVATFDSIGWGQWFRYLTGIIEVGSAILIWVPGKQWIGAGLLVCTMACAVLFHLLVLGPSLIPALVLGILAAIILIAHKPV